MCKYGSMTLDDIVDMKHRFLVDRGSELFYDPTTLLEVQQQERGEEPRPRRNSNALHPNPSPQDQFLANAHAHGQASPHRNSSYPYGGSPSTPRYPGQGGYNSVSPGQFYNGRENGSPARMGMGHESLSGMGRRVTRGMGDDAFHGI